jgi:hypothetical protein
MVMILMGAFWCGGCDGCDGCGVELVISEIMFDPEPAVGLAGEEYVEIFNPGEDTVDLSGWRIAVGKEKVVVVMIVMIVVIGEGTGYKLLPGHYAVLKGKGLPGLKNTGDRVTLLDPQGREVHSVEYAPEMHKDALKAHGGWSLELADLKCWNEREAWVSSEDPLGGTPGRENSVRMELPEPAAPQLIRMGWYDECLMFAWFSGTLRTSGEVKARLKPGGLELMPAPAPVYGFPGLFFRAPAEFSDTVIYKVELEGTMHSCYGGEVVLKPAYIARSHAPDSADVVINEVMFDPVSGDPEWIELLNRSSHVVDIKDFIIARADTEGIIKTFSFPPSSFLLPPSSFLLLPDSFALLSESNRPTFPSLTNEPSRLILMDLSQQVIDEAAYSPDLHDPYLTDSKGISLERINPATSGLQRSNWYSCDQFKRATPCSQNSQYKPFPDSRLPIHDSRFTIPDSRSSPLLISYTYSEPGWYHELRVYDRSGALVRTAVPFGLAGTEGMLMWDTLDDRQQKVVEGIYVLVVRYRHPDGRSGCWKSVCGVVSD